MNITPYTPVKELKRAIRHTYATQAVFALVSAAAVRFMMLMFDMAVIIFGGEATAFSRVFSALTFGLSLFFMIKALSLLAGLFIDAANARRELRWLIAKKQAAGLR